VTTAATHRNSDLPNPLVRENTNRGVRRIRPAVQANGFLLDVVARRFERLLKPFENGIGRVDRVPGDVRDVRPDLEECSGLSLRATRRD
jgi:hypothetical protein